MRLHRLSLTAFGPFGGDQEIDFDSLSAAGLFLLHGATGAGKTSLLDAVCYALYGSVPGARHSGQGTGLRSDHAAPAAPTRVVLDFTAGGRRLEVTRQPSWDRPKKRGTGTTTEKAVSLLRARSADGEWTALSRSHQETGEEISALLGMSKEQFCQVVLLPQGDFARFLRADAETRGRLLGRLFDTHRFAAVEQHLAEQRRRGLAAVQDGDRGLLADAHRIQQAAGDTAPEPPPDLAPGDPGLAEAVLSWAAAARSAARERLTITRLALDTAQAAATAAAARLADIREIHRLQRRHAEARHRADLLAADRASAEETRRRLDRARAAEAVRPALALREAADSAHRAAAEDRVRTTAALPADCVGLDVSGLTAAAREAARLQGGLDAARRAEERLARLHDDLARLEREERSADEQAHEAADWLDSWPDTRDRLTARITAAQDAATHAQRLAAHLETARARLTAARRRDELTADAGTAHRAVLAARERAGTAHEHWLSLKERRLQHIAAELADALTDGEPCAVCGSRAHPRPARRAEGHVARQAEDTALADYRRADRERTAAEARHTAVREELAAAAASASAAPLHDLATTVDNLEKQHTEAHDEAARLHSVREELAHAERERERRGALRQEAARSAASRASLRDALEREREALRADIERARGGADSVAARAGQLRRRAALLTEALDAARAAERTARQLKDADAGLADAAYRAGYATPEAAVADLLDAAGHRALQQALDERRTEEAAVRSLLEEPGLAAAAAHDPVDPGSAGQAADTAQRRLREASSAHDTAVRRCAELDSLSARVAAGARELGPMRARHDRVARLAALTAGTSADNERKMRLESYVLAARLEQVAAAATARLRHMSSGRYTLVHSDDRSGRGRSGLGLHVIDAWTGRERDTSTLSGGETFFASLALALGLADVVTDEAGGVRLDTLFIDEGFGSLDDQTLDEVLDVLDALRERDRSVGIVSHVADLRRRVPVQLEVVKGRTGSTVRRRDAGG